MSCFIGRYPLNYAPVANERVLVGLKQYGERAFRSPAGSETTESRFMGAATAVRKPLDHIAHILYPYHDHDSELLGRCGISTAVHDSAERVGYDFFNELGYAKLVSARYVDGCGIYEVTSQKSLYRLRTTTWVPRPAGVDGIIRRTEAASMKDGEASLHVFPQLHLRGELYERDGVLVSKQILYESQLVSKAPFPLTDAYMAVKCEGAEGWFCGEWSRDDDVKFNNNTVEFDPQSRKPNVTFKVTQTVSDKEWGEPIHLLIGLGETEEDALWNLQAIEQDETRFYDSTHRWWMEWHQQGIAIETENSLLNDVLGVAKTLMRMAFDENGLTTYMGYYWYQGAVWIRDNSWIAMGLSRIGYPEEAFRILTGLRNIVKKREDGSFHFLYSGRTKEIGDFSWESDSMGLILTAAGYWFDESRDLVKAADLWEWLSYCAEWICGNIDETVGLIVRDAGIWEEWSDEYGQQREHMTWTSLLSAYGIKKAADIARALGHHQESEKYEAAFSTLREGIEKRCVKDGILVRSPESKGRNLDSSVLYAWTWTPIFSPDAPLLKRLLAVVEERLWDPAVGGLWRHENANNDLGDTLCWPCSTLWAAECYAYLNQKEKVGQYLEWVLDHTTECAQIPECMFAEDMPHVTGMTSLSCIGIWGFMLGIMAAQREGFELPSIIGSIASIDSHLVTRQPGRRQ